MDGSSRVFAGSETGRMFHRAAQFPVLSGDPWLSVCFFFGVCRLGITYLES